MKKNIILKKNQGNRGFTLVELLAVIAILSIVLSIVVYFAINVIGEARKKSYKVTINNIENQASSYVLEDISMVDWVDGSDHSYQYQCLTVQNLIDAGYFKGDVLESKVDENRRVEATDYVYLERDSSTKTITKNILLVGKGASYAGLCSGIKVSGNININVEPSGWAREKNITIDYKISNNLDSVNSYTYNYVYETISGNIDRELTENFASTYSQKGLTVNENGTINAKIEDSAGKLVESKSLTIDKIDLVAPDAEIVSKGQVNSVYAVTLKMDDNGGSGVKSYYFGKENPSTTDVEWVNKNVVDSIEVDDEVDSEGTWYLGVKDLVGNTTIINQYFDKPIYKVYIKYNVNGGTIQKQSTTASGNVYTFTTDDNGVISVSKNGGTAYSNLNTINYGDSLGSDGLNNWDNSKYIKISKTGYSAVSNAEWKCLSSNCLQDTYSDSTVYTAEDFCDATLSDCTVTLGVNWTINKVYIRYNVNGGTIDSETTNSAGTTTYNWSTDDDGIISVSKNGGTYSSNFASVSYGGSLGKGGLANWDNSSYMDISKSGYSAKSGAEWKCKSGNCKQSTYSDSTNYTAAQLCDASVSSCTVVLGVNWVANTYKITYDANGGSGAPSDQSITAGVATTLSSKVPTYQDEDKLYGVFLGWNTKSNGSGTSYDPGDSYTGNSNVTLYAQWHEHTWNARGIKVFYPGWSSKQYFNCSVHYHSMTFFVYCTECGMSKQYYKWSVSPIDERSNVSNTLECPCNSGAAYSVLYDDSDLTFAQAKAVSGIYYGDKKKLDVVCNSTSGCANHSKSERDCTEHDGTNKDLYD